MLETGITAILMIMNHTINTSGVIIFIIAALVFSIITTN